MPDDGKTWQFDLNNNRLDVSLSDSVENGLTFYLTSLDGGYIYSGDSLVATVTLNWAQTGATIYFVDGESRSYFLGPVEDILPPGVLTLVPGLL